ncbi:hypothetical protein [Variovorax sp. LG9.2]|uniref:hypothetical protein n=1 Tax=Variovorax sp. LG9.2 TaxID=3048626 RepID=UPI002B225EA8|nr:hypothetical protein [Variovorax sp. LG9.2]MEB0059713.1 hypothetical protein [Variovorax sp. LG9.2]
MTQEITTLQERVKDAVHELLAATGAASFCLTLEAGPPAILIAAGEPTQIWRLVGEPPAAAAQ